MSACCDIFVHCALSLIILFYICACCDTRCFKKCLFILVCRIKSPTGLMLHVVQYSTQNKISMSTTRISFLGLQETVIGPLMFLLYIYVIGDNFSPTDIRKLFGNDCLLYKTIKSISDKEQLQQDLYTMVECSNTWLMRFQSYTF